MQDSSQQGLVTRPPSSYHSRSQMLLLVLQLRTLWCLWDSLSFLLKWWTSIFDNVQFVISSVVIWGPKAFQTTKSSPCFNKVHPCLPPLPLASVVSAFVLAEEFGEFYVILVSVACTLTSTLFLLNVFLLFFYWKWIFKWNILWFWFLLPTSTQSLAASPPNKPAPFLPLLRKPRASKEQ